MIQRPYRMNPHVYVALIPFFVVGPVAAGEREVIKTGWSGFEQQVSARKLEGRTVRITPAGGGEIKLHGGKPCAWIPDEASRSRY